MATVNTQATFEELLDLAEKLVEGYLAGDVAENDVVAAVDAALVRAQQYRIRIQTMITQVNTAKGK